MKNSEENRTAFDRLMFRNEALAVENSKLREQANRKESDSYQLGRVRRDLDLASEHLRQSVAEIERMRKRHPKMVKLPKFMRPLSDEDIPF